MDLTVNGIPIGTFCGSSLLDYTIGESSVENATFKGINRTNWVLLKSMFGTRAITITIIFKGETLHAAKVNRSKFNAAILGKSEIYIPDDGFFYDVSCDSLGDEILVGIGQRESQIKSTYTLTGIRRGAKKAVTVGKNQSFLCESTTPFTDCKLTLTSTQTVSEYNFGGGVWEDIASGDVLVFDGINCKITKNGTNYAQHVTWMDFPSLAAGLNTIETDLDDVVVEYYPAYL